MPRRSRKNLNSHFFHVVVQGLNKQYIFYNSSFINQYLSLIFHYMNNFNINLIAYCVMGNHAHLLIESNETLYLSKFMHIVNQKFAQYYNFKNDRTGYVFKDRFFSEPIDNYNYLLNCFVYIHNNPIKANLVNNCIDYPYSSFIDYVTRTNIATKNNITLLFENEENYINKLLYLHRQNSIAFDIDLTQSEIINFKISNFESKYSFSLSTILNDEILLSKLVFYLKNSYSPIKITYKQISEILGISINQIRRILSIT